MSLEKNPRLEVSALREVARGMPCTLLLPGITRHDPETTVWCHSNQYAHGKGARLKAHDPFGAFGCALCHAELDQGNRLSTAEKRDYFGRAMKATRAFLLDHDIVKVLVLLTTTTYVQLVDDEFLWYAAWKSGHLAVDKVAAKKVRHYGV